MKQPGPLAWSFFFFWINQKLSNFFAYQWVELSPFIKMTINGTITSLHGTQLQWTTDRVRCEQWGLPLTGSSTSSVFSASSVFSSTSSSSPSSAVSPPTDQKQVLTYCRCSRSTFCGCVYWLTLEILNAVESLIKHKCIHVLACITKIRRVCDLSLHATYIAYGKTCYIYLEIIMYGILLQWIPQFHVKSLCRICRTYKIPCTHNRMKLCYVCMKKCMILLGWYSAKGDK